MSEGGQTLICICAVMVAIGAVMAGIGYLVRSNGYRKGCSKGNARDTEGPEFMATNCIFRGREIYLYTEGYGDLGLAGEAAQAFAQVFNEGLDVRKTLHGAGHFCDDLRDQLAHYCGWCGRWFAESIEDGEFCAECSRRLAEHFKERPA